jgi:ferritin-like metal-binding protein YciE
LVFSIDAAFIVCYPIFIMTKLDTAYLMRQKFILELNGALAMENAGIERLQNRISETIVPEAKQKMQHHLEESKVHIERLNQLISSLGGQPYQGKLGLPLPKYPQPMFEKMNNSMTKPEWELKRSEEDLISESAESICYLMLIQKAQMAGGVFQNAIEPLSLNMKDEENMAEWIKTNTPFMLDNLWPQIEEDIASSPLASSPATSSQSSSQSPSQSQ